MTGWCFDRVPLSANKLNRHWRIRYREKKAWSDWILAVAGNGPYRAAIGGQPGTASRRRDRVRLGVTVYRSRPQDTDNAWASVKPICDALKARGWLVDDSPTWLDLYVWERKCKRSEERTEIVWDRIEAVTLAEVPK